jgi:hypothetical protein
LVPIPYGDRLGSIGAQLVSHGEACLDPLGSDEIAVIHAERVEDVFAEITVERFSAHVRDELPERGEAMVGVGESRARLGVNVEATPVVVGEGRLRPHCSVRRGSAGMNKDGRGFGRNFGGDIDASRGHLAARALY